MGGCTPATIFVILKLQPDELQPDVLQPETAPRAVEDPEEGGSYAQGSGSGAVCTATSAHPHQPHVSLNTPQTKQDTRHNKQQNEKQYSLNTHTSRNTFAVRHFRPLNKKSLASPKDLLQKSISAEGLGTSPAAPTER